MEDLKIKGYLVKKAECERSNVMSYYLYLPKEIKKQKTLYNTIKLKSYFKAFSQGNYYIPFAEFNEIKLNKNYERISALYLYSMGIY